MLAPTDGDAGARANESARLLLAQAEADAVADCMRDAGVADYAQLPVLNASNLIRGHAEFVSPAKLENRGIVVMSDPALETVPVEAQAALGTCLGEDGARSVSAATDRFVVFRDSTENPFAAWPTTVRTEVQRIAESGDPGTDGYRECFRQLGVPADVSRNATDAGSWLISEMNDRTDDFSPARVEDWEQGRGVLDADGGALAREAAQCFRSFQELLTPRLRELRDDVLEDSREAVMEGQALFYDAIGDQSFDPDDYDF
ncbi:UNVERIFIED_ORG: hypothetical protein E4P37_11380 [Bacillus sp. AZ43]